MAANFWSSSQCDLLLEARERRAEEASRAPKPKARPRRRQIVLRGVEPEPGEPGSSGGGPGSVVTQLVDYAVLLSKELKIRQRPVLTACAYLWRLRPETLDPPENAVGWSELDDERHITAVTMACVYLACKVEEQPVSADKVAGFSQGLCSATDLLDAELCVLEDLSASLVVHHPIDDVERYASLVHADGEASKVAMACAEETRRTDLLLRYPPHVIALGCLRVAMALEGADTRPWCEQNGVCKEDVKGVCAELVKRCRSL